jgi:hypothetical protein
MLTHKDKQTILSDFPNIKLSYENISHKKVYNSDMIFLIPEGKKYFAWFTYVNDKQVCLIMELGEDKNIVDIKYVNACFSNELSYGTIFYGTLLYHLNSKFFIIEDIFSCKGEFVERDNWINKLKKINGLLRNDLKQMSYNSSFVVFGLPIICKTNDELENKIKKITYKVDSIQYRLYNRINNYLFMKYKSYIENKLVYKYDELYLQDKLIPKILVNQEPKREQLIKYEAINIHQIKKEIVFLIKPDIQNDIYYLYCLNEKLEEEYYGTAHIPDYNTSVMMNKLFRIIKENNKLDALEESDDEEEFENESLTKFVHLDKSYKMICQLNYKFKKWTPIRLANNKSQIINNKDVINLCKTQEQHIKK